MAEAGFRLECLDLRGEEAREATTATIVREEAARPFDLGRGPLLRAKLLRVADAEYVFLLTLHHIISDGWSMGVLLREALALYAAYARGEENPLAPLSIQYRDFAAWQHAQAESERVRAQAHYWQAQLGGDLPVLELPADHPRPAAKSFRGGSVPFVLDGELTTRLHALGGPHGTSLFMTLLASVYALLYRYSGQTDVVLGAPISGRDHADVEGQVGLFVNMLALRTRLEPEASFGQLLDRVKAQTLAAYAHAEYPFDRVVQDLRLDPAPDRSPLFDVVVQMQDPQQSVLPQDPLAGGVQLAPYPSAHHASKFDLTFNFLEAGGEIQADLEYSTDLFGAGTAKSLAAELAELLRLVVRSPHLSLKELKRQLAARRGAGAAYAAYVNTDLSADF